VDRGIKETLKIKPILVDMQITVKDIIDHVKEAMQNAMEMRATKLVLYYVGHGHEEYGGWVTHWKDDGSTAGLKRDKFVHVHDILNAIESHEYDDLSVEITSESCFSGQICHQAKTWWEDLQDGERGFNSLRVLGSTYKGNKGVWGKYREFKSNYSSDNTN